MTETTKEIAEGKFFAVISYISFFCIITLLLKKQNKFALYHAKQGLVLFVVEVVSLILSVIPILGWLLRVFGTLIFLLVAFWGILSALQGKLCRIPLISDIADKIVL